jgi:hypothetical protein
MAMAGTVQIAERSASHGPTPKIDLRVTVILLRGTG